MVQPRLLTKGDRVAIVAPAGRLDNHSLDRALAILKSWGLEVIPGRFINGHHGYFSGTDEERLTDLQNALDDPTIAAILFARGGYGVTRILDKISLAAYQAAPKWLIGFSDITALHLKLSKVHLPSIHGDMGTTLGQDEASTIALQNLLFTGESSLTTAEPFRQGAAKGILVGGNLSLIIDSLGTDNEIETAQRILFLEEIEEKTYRVDRMLWHLQRAGKLSNLAGLVVGQFTNITDGGTPFGMRWQDCLIERVQAFEYPVAFGWPIGHEAKNFPVIHGANYQLLVEAEMASLTRLSS